LHLRQQLLENDIGRSIRVDLPQNTAVPVVRQQRRRLGPIHFEALADRFFAVVGALRQLTAAVVANTLLLRRLVVDVPDGATL
jgi:hypothetical protein